MRRLDVSPLAIADIHDIAEFSSWSFGHRQTDRYLEDFDAVFLSLLEFPDIGKSVTYAGVIYQRIRSGSHFAYYVYDDEILRIIRVLHVSRDQAKALSKVP